MAALCKKSNIHKTMVVSVMLLRAGCSGRGGCGWAASLDLQAAKCEQCSELSGRRKGRHRFRIYKCSTHKKNIFVLNSNKGGEGEERGVI